MKKWAIGIDIGGTKIEIGVVDESGEIIRSQQIFTAVSKGPLFIQNQLIDIIHSLSTDFSPVGIGIGIPGQMDPENEIILFAKNLNWVNEPLKNYLSERLGLDVFITNDVKAATLGEWRYGAGIECDDFVCLFIGTGIGGGIVSGGKLLKGSTNTAGEFGHMITSPQGPLCSCGSWGCLEAQASGWALQKQAQEMVKYDPFYGKILVQKCGGQIELITGKMVTEAAAAGDLLSKQLMKQAYHALSLACVNIVNILNPSKLIIGGGLSKGMPDLLPYLLNEIQKSALKPAQNKIQVIRSKLMNNAAIVGAAQLVFDNSGC